MDLKSIEANSAYAEALSRAATDAGSAASGVPTGGGSEGGFAALLSNLTSQVEASTANAEVVSAQAVAGQAGLVDVVTAVNNAEMVLETVTTVRDRVVRAYEEIMRMPI